MKKYLVITMLAFLVLCWYVTTESFLGNGAKFDAEMKKASELEKKEIYITAIDCYKNALTYKPGNYDAMYGIATDYKKLEEEDNYAIQMKSILDKFGADEKVLQELYNYYLETDELDDAAELAYEMKEKYPDNELVNKIYKEREGDYSEIFASFATLSSFDEGYAVFESEGKKGLINENGEIVIEAFYDEIGCPFGEEGYIPVKKDGKAYLINSKAYKIAHPDGGYTYLSGVSSECILAQKNGKFGYLDTAYVEKTKFEWDDATRICYGIGAVKKGEKWALINSSFELVTDYIYEDVVQNDWRICSYNQVVWVKKDGKYQLVDSTGAVISKAKYDMARPFAGEQPCAVMKDEKWGFVSADGTEFIKPQYEGAESFNLGYAPVKKQEQWGLIDQSGALIMKHTFDEMKPLGSSGAIPVKRQEVWTVVTLKIFE